MITNTNCGDLESNILRVLRHKISAAKRVEVRASQHLLYLSWEEVGALLEVNRQHTLNRKS